MNESFKTPLRRGFRSRDQHTGSQDRSSVNLAEARGEEVPVRITRRRWDAALPETPIVAA